jgi:hypothetical protein
MCSISLLWFAITLKIFGNSFRVGIDVKTKEKLITSNNRMQREKILVDIPQSDLMFFRLFADKLGWQFSSRQKLWDDFIRNSPENADLSEDEIMEEVKAVRYGKIQDSH